MYWFYILESLEYQILINEMLANSDSVFIELVKRVEDVYGKILIMKSSKIWPNHNISLKNL